MITKIISQGTLQTNDYYNNTEFWETYSSLSAGTATDHMVDVLSAAGYTGTPRDMLRGWLDDGADITASANKKFDGGLFKGPTFLKDFTNSSSVDSGFAIGTGTGTFTRSACDCTYVDASGVVQLVEDANIPRFSGGYYDTTGFVAQPGLLIEGASTNSLVNSYMAADTDGLATGWSNPNDDTNDPTTTVVDATDLINISGARSQRIQMTFSDATWYVFTSAWTAVGSYAQDDYVTGSFWAKGSVDGVNLRIYIKEADATPESGTSHQSAGFETSLSTTEWKKFSFSTQLVDADCSRIGIGFDVINISAADSFDVYITGCQAETLPFASSYIPTTDAAVTRNAEKLTYVISDNRTASTESCVVKVAPEYANNILLVDAIIHDTDTKQRLMNFESAANDIYIKPNNTDDAGVGVFDMPNDSWTANTLFVLGYSMIYAGNPNVSAYLNGAADGTVSNDNYTPNVWGTNFYIGSKNDGSLSLYGTIQEIAFFPDIKSATEHAALYGAI